jgi:Ca2+-binding RTX toxin-like protein
VTFTSTPVQPASYKRAPGEYKNSAAFAALKSDGSVITWGNSSFGGDSSAVSANLASGIEQVFSAQGAFAALKSDGSVITWGQNYSGGDSSAVSANLTNIVGLATPFADDRLTFDAPTDTEAPTLVSTTPQDATTAVAIGADIVLTFSEEVRHGNDAIKILIKKVSDDSIVHEISVTDSSQISYEGNQVTINPATDLDYATAYYVDIPEGAIEDASGNAFSGTDTLNFTTAAGAQSESTPPTDNEPSQPTPVVDNTPADPAPAGTNIQATDDDGDGLREVITASDGVSVDGNRDGIPDVQQTEVAGLRLINNGALGSDYGALVVSPDVRLSAVTLTSPTTDGSISVSTRGGGTVVTTTPDGITNAFAGVVSFNVSGVNPGGTTQATITFPAGLPAGTGNAYVRFNYSTNRFEEYVDAAGNPLYSFVDSNGDGVIDAVNLTLQDSDSNWDGDGAANGTVVDPGFLAVGEREFSGTKGKDSLTGNLLTNTIRGRKGNDRLQGGLGADVLIGGKGKDRFFYASADESSSSQRDTVKFGKADRFVFSAFDGDATAVGQQQLSFIGKQAFSQG